VRLAPPPVAGQPAGVDPLAVGRLDPGAADAADADRAERAARVRTDVVPDPVLAVRDGGGSHP
jgi:hypothetical protein